MKVLTLFWSLQLLFLAWPCEGFEFIGTPWPLQGGYLFSFSGDNVVFNCTADDPSAIVYAQVEVGQTFVDIATYAPMAARFSVASQEQNQTFVLANLGVGDALRYQCISRVFAVTKILGSLFVSPSPRVYVPHLFPDYETVVVERQGGYQISCSAEGLRGDSASYLRWTRTLSDGSEVDIPLSSITRRDILVQSRVYDEDVLNIVSAGENAVGTYTCRRKVGANAETSKSINVALEALRKPNVTLVPSTDTVTVPEGQRLLVICEVSGSPRPTKAWTRLGVTVVPCTDRFTTDCRLEQQFASFPRDDGEFTCTATNGEGAASDKVRVVVTVPVSVDKPSTIDVGSYDQSKELDCNVKRANPMPKITWRYQLWSCLESLSATECKPEPDKWTDVPPSYVISPLPNTLTLSSKITVPKSRFSAFFSCIADNGFSRDVHNVTLRRRQSLPSPFEVSAAHEIVNERDRLVLRCRGQFGVISSLAWLKGDQRVTNTTETVLSFEVDDVHEVLVLTFPSARLSDKGNYTCQATLSRGGNLTKYSYIDVKELALPSIHDFTNEVIYDNVSHVVLNCNVTGNPQPTLEWSFNGLSLASLGARLVSVDGCRQSNPGHYYLQGETSQAKLVICKPDFELHQGSYACEATSKLGNARQMKSVTILGKPKIKQWLSIMTYTLGNPLDLFCSAVGNPTPNITWYRITDDIYNPIPNTSPHKNSSGVYVTIETTGLDAAGNFSCVAINVFGRTANFVMVQAAGAITSGKSSGVSTGMIAGVVAAFFILMLIFIILLLWYRRRLEKKYALYLKPNPDFQLDPDRTLFEQSSELPYDPDWEFPRDRLIFQKNIGSGAFGMVWLAKAHGIETFNARDKSSSALRRRAKLQKGARYASIGPKRRKQAANSYVGEETLVAVKTLKDDASDNEYKDLASELKILIHIGEHKNIVNLLGACTRTGKLCVILEYCVHGSLLTFMRQRREIFNPVWAKHQSDMENEYTYIDLVMTAYQVAKAMDFLASKKCVHRDLAARNVLVGVDYIIKLADFGLARDIYKDELYLKSTSGLLPVKWMSPESLFDKVYTAQSDVWSYGIVLWEIFTLGGSPYPGLPTEDLFSYLEDGRRMDQPDICPPEIYAIMRDCWEKNPEHRPLFSQITDRLGSILKSNISSEDRYLDFADQIDLDEQSETDYLVPVNDKEHADDGYQKIRNPGPRNGIDYNNLGLTHSPLPQPSDGSENSHELLPRNGSGYIPMEAAMVPPSGHYDTVKGIVSSEVTV